MLALTTTNQPESKMVAATQAYHPRVLAAIHALARWYARNAAQHAIRARGGRVSDYAAKDISRMGQALLEQRWEEFIAKATASPVVEEVRLACERKERRKIERKRARTGHILSRSATTPAGRDRISQ